MINGAQYRVLQKLLPDIRKNSNFYIYQQDGAPAHRACETAELFQNQTQNMTRTRHVDELQQRILDARDELNWRVILRTNCDSVEFVYKTFISTPFSSLLYQNETNYQ